MMFTCSSKDAFLTFMMLTLSSKDDFLVGGLFLLNRFRGAVDLVDTSNAAEDDDDEWLPLLTVSWDDGRI